MFLVFQNAYFALGSRLFIPWKSDSMKVLFIPKLQNSTDLLEVPRTRPLLLRRAGC
jgi:hypothetical protein